MPSSISASKPKAVTYAKILAGISALLIVAFEISSVYLLEHRSATYARISRQYDEALKIRPAGPGEPPSVLMVGNSLRSDVLPILELGGCVEVRPVMQLNV